MRKLLLVMMIVAGSGCAGEPQDRPPTPVVDPPVAVGGAAGGGGPDTGEWVVTARGVGPYTFGMPSAPLLPLVEMGPDAVPIDPECDVVRLSNAPAFLSFMLVGDRFVRVDVFGGTTATSEGARLGDSEERIRSLYPDVRVEPHRYTTGHYMVVLPLAPADTMHRIVFETDGQRVRRYRAGRMPEVGWVEGCG
jgi:hypothetical protein